MKTRGRFVVLPLVVATVSVGCHSSNAGPGGGANDAGPVAAIDSGTPDGAVAGACAITAPTVTDWRIHADGTVFRDSLNRAVLFRGVDAGGRSKFAPYVPFDYPAGGFATALAAYMDLAASWGINAMRVPFTWAALEPTQGQNDANWLAMYDQILAAAWARGIYTVVDFHQDVYSEVFCGDGFPGWTVPDAGPPAHDCSSWQLEYFNDPAVEAAFDNFWDASSPVQVAYGQAWDLMVNRYKDTPGVLGFEPINEPGWGTADEGTFSATTLTAFYSVMVPRMRAQAPSSLIFVDPPGVDGSSVSTRLAKPTGDGIVFAPHYYPIGLDSLDATTALTAWTTVGASWNVPVFLGEFGTSNTEAQYSLQYMTDVFTALDALGLSGTEWEYSESVDAWNMETDGIVAADGGEYPVIGALLRPYARAVAGTALTQSWDPTTSTFAASFTPTTGITDLSVPARAYPSGAAVTITGACFDATTPGRILIQPTPGAPQVTLSITAR